MKTILELDNGSPRFKTGDQAFLAHDTQFGDDQNVPAGTPVTIGRVVQEPDTRYYTSFIHQGEVMKFVLDENELSTYEEMEFKRHTNDSESLKM
jgi:hypothetical protein